MPRRLVHPALSTLFAMALAGCGSGEFDTAVVNGKLTCGGQPVTTGSVSFSPVAPEGGGEPGKAASGKVQPDGTFVLTTYEYGDGAVVGKHIVSWVPPEPGSGDDDEEGGTPAAAPARGAKLPCPFGGMAEAEVVDGENDLSIELTRMGAPESGDND